MGCARGVGAPHQCPRIDKKSESGWGEFVTDVPPTLYGASSQWNTRTYICVCVLKITFGLSIRNGCTAFIKDGGITISVELNTRPAGVFNSVNKKERKKRNVYI